MYVCASCVYGVSHVYLTCRNVRRTAKRSICCGILYWGYDLLAPVTESPKGWLKCDQYQEARRKEGKAIGVGISGTGEKQQRTQDLIFLETEVDFSCPV